LNCVAAPAHLHLATLRQMCVDVLLKVCFLGDLGFLFFCCLLTMDEDNQPGNQPLLVPVQQVVQPVAAPTPPPSLANKDV